MDDECDTDHDGEETPLMRGNSSTPPGPSMSPDTVHRPPSSSSSSSSSASASSPRTAAAGTAAGGIHVSKARSSHSVVNIICVVILIATSAGGLTNIPLTKLVEDAFCRQYYHDRGWQQGENTNLILNNPTTIHLRDDRRCKEGSIQSQVAFLFGIAEAANAVVAFCVALPWGIAADRMGRKPVIATALVGAALSYFWLMAVLWFQPTLPIWLAWLSSAWLIIGGGNAVIVAVLLSIVTDVTAEDTRAVFFMRIHVAGLVGNLASPALSSALMNITGPWPVMWLAVAGVLVAAATVMFVPESLHRDHGNPPTHDDEPVPYPSHEIPADTASGAINGTVGLKEHVMQTLYQLTESLSVLNSPSLVILLTTDFLMQPVASAMMQLLIQYVSNRFRIKIEDTGYVQTTYGAAQVFQALVGIPVISRLMTMSSPPSSSPPSLRHHRRRRCYRRGQQLLRRLFTARNGQQRDLLLTRWSFFVLVPGLLLVGAAPTLPVFILGLLVMAVGSGYASFTRSLMSLYVDLEHRSRLFTLVGMVETAGSVYSGPMLAAIFSLGMKLGGGHGDGDGDGDGDRSRSWIGLPYYVLAMMTTAASMLLFL